MEPTPCEQIEKQAADAWKAEAEQHRADLLDSLGREAAAQRRITALEEQVATLTATQAGPLMTEVARLRNELGEHEDLIHGAGYKYLVDIINRLAELEAAQPEEG